VNQRPSERKPKKKPQVLVLSGPSGVGKDTVLSRLRKQFPKMHYVITATTRPLRPGEIDGVDHIFLSEAEFRERLSRDEFLETAQVYEQWYGVPKEQVQRALARGQDVVARVDVQGAASIRREMPEAVLVFLMPPSFDELRRRLILRRTEGSQELALRLESAKRESEEAKWFNHIVVNATDEVTLTVTRIMDILEVERARSTPLQPPTQLTG